jgi:hypothetical protein
MSDRRHIKVGFGVAVNRLAPPALKQTVSVWRGSMKNSMKWVILLVLALLLGAAQAWAGCAAPVNGRQANQQARIHQGVVQGDLTLREQARLQGRQHHIAHVESRYRSNDGVLGPRERCDLNRRLNSSSQQIRRQRHDGQRYY